MEKEKPVYPEHARFRVSELKRHPLLEEARQELSMRMGVRPGELRYVGMLQSPLAESMYIPLFTIIRRSSPFYRSTRSANMLLRWDEKSGLISRASSWIMHCREFCRDRPD
jgi:hypothetical protein